MKYGIDPDQQMLDVASKHSREINYIQGNALSLPFKDNSFDYSVAITSLCFIDNPEQALSEMWRVSRNGILLGLLNRNSILYHQKYNQGAYHGARWDTCQSVSLWLESVKISAKHKTCHSTVFVPGGGLFSRTIEHITPGILPFGGFLSVNVEKHYQKS